MKKIIALIIACITCVSATTATDYDVLEVKARRFYQFEEWPSAIAMYQLMLEQHPEVSSTYSHAIVAAGMGGMKDEQMRLLRRSMDAHVPLDSIYDGVQKSAFELGDADLYEDFLEQAGREFTWLGRNIDSRLLDYYCWRNDGEGMIEYARLMLRATPDNISFLTALADGYFTVGDLDKGVETYTRIVVLDPTNYHALLVLGNYFYEASRDNRFDSGSKVLARQYLERAYKLRPTPYVEKLLSETAGGVHNIVG